MLPLHSQSTEAHSSKSEQLALPPRIPSAITATIIKRLALKEVEILDNHYIKGLRCSDAYRSQGGNVND